jgi:hypothetical protein
MIHKCDGISDPVVRGQDSSRFVSRSHPDPMSRNHFDIKTVELWLVSRQLKLATAWYTNIWMHLDATESRDFRSTTPQLHLVSCHLMMLHQRYTGGRFSEALVAMRRLRV